MEIPLAAMRKIAHIRISTLHLRRTKQAIHQQLMKFLEHGINKKMLPTSQKVPAITVAALQGWDWVSFKLFM